jgi:hypothetical protein
MNSALFSSYAHRCLPALSGGFDHLFDVLLRDGHVVAFLRVLHGHLDNLLFIAALHGEIAGGGTLDYFHLFCHGLSPPDGIHTIIEPPLCSCK